MATATITDTADFPYDYRRMPLWTIPEITNAIRKLHAVGRKDVYVSTAMVWDEGTPDAYVTFIIRSRSNDVLAWPFRAHKRAPGNLYHA